MYEIYEQIGNGRNIMATITIKPLQWAGHINKANDNCSKRKL